MTLDYELVIIFLDAESRALDYELVIIFLDAESRALHVARNLYAR